MPSSSGDSQPDSRSEVAEEEDPWRLRERERKKERESEGNFKI